MVDFGRYVHSFREPKSYSLGPAIRELMSQNQRQQTIDNQASQYDSTRSDTQAVNAADHARTRGEDAYKTLSGRHAQQQKLVDAATQAAQSGDWNTARALLPRVLELGGEAAESGTPEAPIFRFKSGAAPERAPLDYGGTRAQIYGGAPPSAPPPVAPGDRNPMDPPSLPGASAAAMGPPPASMNQAPPPAAPPELDPPPGAARSVPPEGAVWLPPGVDPGQQPTSAEADLAALESAQAEPELAEGAAAPPPPAPPAPGEQAAQPGSEQLTGPNPFDPYTIDTSRVTASNRLRLDPMLRGIEQAAPSRYQDQVSAFNENLGSLRLSPTATLDAAKPFFQELAGMYRGEVAAAGQSGRAEMMALQRQSAQDDKSRRDARGVVSQIIRTESLTKTKDKVNAAREASELLEGATTNPNMANALIESLYRMRNTGVMTDKDYDRSSKGVQSAWSALKNGTLNTFFQINGGFHPGMVRDIKELIERGSKAHRETLMQSRDAMYRAWKGAPTQAHRDVYDESIRINFPEEYWPEEFTQQYGGEQVPEYEQEDEEAVMEQMRQGENLGRSPVPAGAHPNMPPELPLGPGAVRGSRVPPKPPRKPPPQKEKDPKDMTDEEVSAEVKKMMEE